MPETKHEDGKPVESEEKREEDVRKVSRAKLDKALEAQAKAEADCEHWKNEYYRAYADTQNLRRALEEEKNAAIRYRAEEFLGDLLPARDAFHMALESPAPSKEAANYLVGFTYIYNQLVAALANEGVTEISAKPGDTYDLHTMHALDQIETDEIPAGKVAKVYTKGYKLHDRLIRAAMVGVAKAPNQEEKPAEGQENPESETAKA